MIRISTSTLKIEANLTEEQEANILATAAGMAIQNMTKEVDQSSETKVSSEAESKSEPKSDMVTEAIYSAAATQPDWPGRDENAWSGFIIAECETCGASRAFCTKDWISEFTCKKCGRTTELRDKATVSLTCPKCGKSWYYLTNANTATVEASCLECGTVMIGVWDKGRKAYVPEEES